MATGVKSAPSTQVQFPIPTTAADVHGPEAGNTMTKEYVQMVGRMAYFWGWPLVANANRAVAFSKAPEPGLVGGVVPIAYRGIAMLTDYLTADQRVVACSNQDVVYGPGFLPLDEEPFVCQVPDFGDRFWVYALYDARTDEFSEIGKQLRHQTRLLFDCRSRTGKAKRRRASRRWCVLPRRWHLPFRVSSWTTRRRIARPSNRY